jgi:hypothetical protein
VDNNIICAYGNLVFTNLINEELFFRILNHGFVYPKINEKLCPQIIMTFAVYNNSISNDLQTVFP